MNAKYGLMAVVLLFACQSYACKCGGPGSVKDSFAGSNAVFSGKVLSLETVPYSQTIKPDSVQAIRKRLKGDDRKLEFFDMNYIFKVEFEVIEKYKGVDVVDTVTIFTPIQGGSCGYKFEVGSHYIVYGSKEYYLKYFIIGKTHNYGGVEIENTYWTNHCTRTTEYNSLEADELRLLSKK